jgi:hypothetical protein
VNPIARFEQLCARAVEGTFARIFPSALEPSQVGRKLVAAHAATPTDTFLVRVHPDDYARLAADRAFLEARWSALVRESAPDGEAPRVILHEDPAVVSGSVAIEAVLDEPDWPAMLVGPDGAATPLRDGLRIGRSEDNDVVLRDGRVSRVHARIIAEDGGFAIEDAGSTNGTFVDGRAVRRARLRPGAKVVLGETVLEVR